MGRSSTISAELGVDVDGLSAKLSATFEHSITVSQETTDERSWTFGANEGKLTVWGLWQLVHEIVGLLPDGSVVGGWPYGTCGANIAVLPWLGDMNGDTSIRTARVTQRSVDTYALLPTEFPMPGNG